MERRAPWRIRWFQAVTPFGVSRRVRRGRERGLRWPLGAVAHKADSDSGVVRIFTGIFERFEFAAKIEGDGEGSDFGLATGMTTDEGFVAFPNRDHYLG